jgi:hypothetical protein
MFESLLINSSVFGLMTLGRFFSAPILPGTFSGFVTMIPPLVFHKLIHHFSCYTLKRAHSDIIINIS